METLGIDEHPYPVTKVVRKIMAYVISPKEIHDTPSVKGAYRPPSWHEPWLREYDTVSVVDSSWEGSNGTIWVNLIPEDVTEIAAN